MKNKFIFKSQINDKKNEINNFSKITQSEIIFNYFKIIQIEKLDIPR